MGLVATVTGSTLSELGTPTADRCEGVLELPSGRAIDVDWRKGKGWAQSAHDLTFTQMGPTAMKGPQSAGWSYVYNAQGPVRPLDEVWPRSHGFHIHWELNPREVWDAGFRLQERLCGFVMSPDPGSQEDADGGEGTSGAAWFELDLGGGFLTPDADTIPPLMGVRLTGELGGANAWRWWDSGWRNSPIAMPAADKVLYPNWYKSGPELCFMACRALRRWVGGDDLALLEEGP